jgi:hypothetical protein
VANRPSPARASQMGRATPSPSSLQLGPLSQPRTAKILAVGGQKKITKQKIWRQVAMGTMTPNALRGARVATDEADGR